MSPCSLCLLCVLCVNSFDFSALAVPSIPQTITGSSKLFPPEPYFKYPPDSERTSNENNPRRIPDVRNGHIISPPHRRRASAHATRCRKTARRLRRTPRGRRKTSQRREDSPGLAQPRALSRRQRHRPAPRQGRKTRRLHGRFHYRHVGATSVWRILPRQAVHRPRHQRTNHAANADSLPPRRYRAQAESCR